MRFMALLLCCCPAMGYSSTDSTPLFQKKETVSAEFINSGWRNIDAFFKKYNQAWYKVPKVFGSSSVLEGKDQQYADLVTQYATGLWTVFKPYILLKAPAVYSFGDLSALTDLVEHINQFYIELQNAQKPNDDSFKELYKKLDKIRITFNEFNKEYLVHPRCLVLRTSHQYRKSAEGQ